MNSTLKALSALLCCLALPALAYNHEEVVGPLPAGKYAVACSNVEIDTARLAQLGGKAADYYEGHTVNGQTRYITDILAHPESAFRFQDRVPAEPLLYPTLFLQRPDFVALVCHPTSRNNTDANYRLPDDGGLVPHMQPAGQPAKIISASEYAVTAGRNIAEKKNIESLCAAKGMRMTEQRRVIARVLAESDDHPDVEELYRRCVKVDDRISISTVYRTMRLFEDAGIIERHDFRDGRARYETSPDIHHDHLINLRNGEVIEFQSEEIERLQAEVARKLGYKLVDHRLELYAVPLSDDKTKR